jgi:hypothetical protein
MNPDKYVPLVNAKNVQNPNVNLKFTNQQPTIVMQPMVQYVPVYQASPYPTFGTQQQPNWTYNNSNNNNYIYNPGQIPYSSQGGFPEQKPEAPKEKTKFEDYYNKTIENSMIKRTSMIGNHNLQNQEFDDYFEKHIEKFFTPEINEIVVYHSPGYLLGIHVVYRDPWGKFDKETYKAGVHLPKSLNPKTCGQSSLKFEYDEFPKEIFVDGTEYISYLKVVSSKGKVLEVGKPSSSTLVNQVPELGRILGVGGTYSLCLTSLYFYYL